MSLSLFSSQSLVSVATCKCMMTMMIQHLSSIGAMHVWHKSFLARVAHFECFSRTDSYKEEMPSDVGQEICSGLPAWYDRHSMQSRDVRR